MRRLFSLALAALVVLVAACGSDDGGGGDRGPAPTEGNLFPNPGFEEGRDPWFSLKPPDFILSEDAAHSGEASALLHMSSPAGEEGTKVFYLVQELQPDEFPEVISGYYRVDKWTKGTPKQYVQFVVIVFGGEGLPQGFPNHQVRYPLAGISEEPFAIGNAFFVFIGKEEPKLGEWVYFERNIEKDFQELWGAAPTSVENLRILLEVRYDDKVPTDGTAEADVYYDDLYIGPAR